MKKLLVGLLLLFSSMFGDCLSNYKNAYYYQGILTSFVIADLIGEGKISMEDTEGNKGKAYLFSVGALSLIDSVKLLNLRTTEQYIINENKKNLQVSMVNFFNGFSNSFEIVKEVADTHKYDIKKAKEFVKERMSYVLEKSLKNMNTCKVI